MASLASLALFAHAQNETTTITIYVPNVSVTVQPVWIVNVLYVNKTHAKLVAACQAISSCPTLTVRIVNSTGYTCLERNITSNTVIVFKCPGGLNASYVYDDVHGVLEARPPTVTTPFASYVLTAAFIGLMLSLAIRSDPRLVPIGMILGAIVLAAATLMGYAGAGAAIVATLAIVVAVILFWMERR